MHQRWLDPRRGDRTSEQVVAVRMSREPGQLLVFERAAGGKAEVVIARGVEDDRHEGPLRRCRPQDRAGGRMQSVHCAGPGRAEVLPGIIEREDIHVDALAVGYLLERQQLARRQDDGRRGARFDDPLEPQVVNGRMS